MSIFINQKEMEENIKESATKLGAPKVKTKKVRVMLAKRKCKMCYGQGKLKHIAPNATVAKDLYCSCVTQKTVDVADNGDSVDSDKFADINALLGDFGV